MKKWYLLLEKNGLVRDAVSAPHDGYIEIEADVLLPRDILAGYWRWDGVQLTVDAEAKEALTGIDEAVNQRISDLEDALAELLFGGEAI